MSDISNLIAELERAEGPDRGLDGMIARDVLGWRPYFGLMGVEILDWVKVGGHWHAPGQGECDGRHSGDFEYSEPPEFTGSIDAALTLVPEGPDNNGREGWILSGLEQISAPWRWKVTLIHCAARWRDFEILHQGIAPTAPIALTIAALKARAS